MRDILTKIKPLTKYFYDINTPFTDKELKEAITYFTSCNVKITDKVIPAKSLTFFIDKDATKCTYSSLMTITMNTKLFVHIYRKMRTLGKSGMCILKALSNAVRDHYFEMTGECQELYLNFDKDRYINEFIMALDNIASVDVDSIIINKFNIKRVVNGFGGYYDLYRQFKLAMYHVDIIMSAIPVTSVSKDGEVVSEGFIFNNEFEECANDLNESYKNFLKELIA